MSDSQGFSGDYQRPQQTWKCGHSEHGHECLLGPSGLGICRAGGVCRPARRGDRWVCQRPESMGGPCDESPNDDGTCCHQTPPCHPIRSLRARRQIFIGGCVMATLGAVFLSLGSANRNHFIAPGPLSAPHAQILAATDDSRCDVCHEAARDSLGRWSLAMVADPHPDLTQSALCLDCHRDALHGQSPLQAHGMNSDSLDTVTQRLSEKYASPLRRVSHPGNSEREIACSTCHQEHQGKTHDLTMLADKQCQTCHQRQFASLSVGHPEFADWPYRKRTRIAFNHGTHEGKHFVDRKATFDCRQCHLESEHQQIVGTKSFSQTCSQCHDGPVRQSLADGIAILNLPMIDTDAMHDAQLVIGQWPDGASGDFDGRLAPLMRILLSADPQFQQASQTLGENFDLFDVDPDDETQLQAVAQVVWAIKCLLYDLGEQGHHALRQRWNAALKSELDEVQLSDLSAHVSTDLFVQAQKRWFPKLKQEVTVYRERLPGLHHTSSSVTGDAVVHSTVAREIGEQTPKVDDILLTSGHEPIPVMRRNPLRTPPPENVTATPTPEPATPTEADSADEDLLTSDNLNADVAVDSINQAAPPRNLSPAERTYLGGWYRNDTIFALLYQPTGHGDLFLKTWLTSLLSLAGDDLKSWSELSAPLAKGLCMSCHRVGITRTTGDRQILWDSTAALRLQHKDFTRFSHSPHLIQPALRDCARCHVPNASTTSGDVATNRSADTAAAIEMAPNFTAISKETCASCHKPHAASDRCTTCHNYHIQK
ncbi:MAG: hypothetical protein R3E01_31305 [Pirellulaceae bacterium]|nr:hypothetical protein [Planctomycetales bacterium]